QRRSEEGRACAALRRADLHAGARAPPQGHGRNRDHAVHGEWPAGGRVRSLQRRQHRARREGRTPRHDDQERAVSNKAVLDDGRGRLEEALVHSKDQLKRIRTGRASTALVDNIRVDYYGTPTPINQMAQVSIPEPRQILIKPLDVSAMKELTKAIMQSDLGSAPQNDGKVLRITLPPLSGEQRQKYAAKVKELCEETRVAMRNPRRDLNKHVDG